MGRVSLFRRMISLLIVMATLAAVPLYADLDDFGREVEEEQEKGPEERNKPKWPDKPDPPPDEEEPWDPDEDQYPMDPEEAEEEAEGMLFGMLLVLPIVIVAGWVIHNMSSYYPDYPYSGGRKVPDSVSHDDDKPLAGSLKRSRASVSATGGFFIEGGDIGANASLTVTSMFLGIIGPEMSYRVWSDDSGTLHSLRFGGRIPIFQFSVLSLYSPMACAMYFDEFDLTGFAVSGLLESHPGRPVSLEAMAGAIIAPELIMVEFSGGIGFHAGRTEFTAAYYGLSHADRIIHSVDFGLSVHM